MLKSAQFIKAREHMYRLNEATDASFFTLFMFLGDGLFKSLYIDFLTDRNSCEFNGNVTSIKKNNDTVTIFVHNHIIPEAIPFTTSTENLLTIIKSWDDLRSQQFEAITLNLYNDVVSMIGS